jgi:GT2 family glycosyltransferase
MKRGDVLILLDHDTKVTRKDWLAKLLTPFADGNVGIVGSYTPADVLPTSSGAWLLQTGVTGEVDLVAACITAYRADIFLDGCEFDPIYAPLWHEDADLCLQARALGYTVHGVDGVGMFHEVGHKEHDLISERNWEFFTRKWQGKGLIKAEANQENDFLALASIAKEFLA